MVLCRTTTWGNDVNPPRTKLKLDPVTGKYEVTVEDAVQLVRMRIRNALEAALLHITDASDRTRLVKLIRADFEGMLPQYVEAP